jgi:hypothetical protein
MPPDWYPQKISLCVMKHSLEECEGGRCNFWGKLQPLKLKRNLVQTDSHDSLPSVVTTSCE